MTAGQLAAMMLTLQHRGCQNINLVTPVELSQDRQQHTVAVLEPARRRLLDISWSFSADETRRGPGAVRLLHPARPGADGGRRQTAGPPDVPSISRRQPTAGQKPVTRHRIRRRRRHRTSGLPAEVHNPVRHRRSARALPIRQGWHAQFRGFGAHSPVPDPGGLTETESAFGAGLTAH